MIQTSGGISAAVDKMGKISLWILMMMKYVPKSLAFVTSKIAPNIKHFNMNLCIFQSATLSVDLLEAEVLTIVFSRDVRVIIDELNLILSSFRFLLIIVLYNR